MLKLTTFLLLLLGALAKTQALQPIEWYRVPGYKYHQNAPGAAGNVRLLIIRSQQEFDALLVADHKADHKTGEPAYKPDFSREILVGLLHPPTDHPTRLIIRKIRDNNDVLETRYSLDVATGQRLDSSYAPLDLARVRGTRWKQFSAVLRWRKMQF